MNEKEQDPLTVTESLVDAKDEARQAESREALAHALLLIEKQLASQTKWIVGVGIGTVALIVAALR
ncbi:MAG: hypothetical protein OXK16_11490 [bacterium]|nr:hypothetical protein [bacterium]